MVKTRRSRRFEPVTPNHHESNTQEEETQYSHEEISKTPQGNPSQGENSESGSRIDQMERVMENMLNFMQGMHLTGHANPELLISLTDFNG